MGLKALFGAQDSPAPGTRPGEVRGSFRVAAAAPLTSDASITSGWWAGVLTAPGVDPVAVVHDEAFVRTEKWPEVGDILPAVVQLSEPNRFKILWAEVATRRDLGLQRAQHLLNAMSGA